MKNYKSFLVLLYPNHNVRMFNYYSLYYEQDKVVDLENNPVKMKATIYNFAIILNNDPNIFYKSNVFTNQTIPYEKCKAS